MVKRLHSLEAISSQIGDADGRRMFLQPELDKTSVDPTQAAVRALDAPIDHPPLAQAVVRGDRVAIALGPNVPQAVAVVEGVVTALVKSGIAAESCAIVVANSNLAEHFRAAVRQYPDGMGDVPVILHDPEDERGLCFVGLGRGHQPLVVNRTIFEADVVLPISRAQSSGGALESLFPQFSSLAVIEEFRTPANRATLKDRKRQRRASIEAGQLIGAALAMQVVPGVGGSVANIAAGEPRAVAHRVAGIYRQRWLQRSEQPANLVVAIVAGGEPEQSWEHVGRAVAAARRLIDDDGAIAICTNLERPPGESMGQLVGQRSAAATARRVFQQRADDSWAAWRIARAIARGTVYFMSQLDADAVEEMGMAPMKDIDELVRLAARRGSTIVLEDAQYALASVDSAGE